MSVESRLKELITRELHFVPSQLPHELDELELSFQDLIKIANVIEDAFKIDLSYAEMEKFVTIKDIVRYINRELQRKGIQDAV